MKFIADDGKIFDTMEECEEYEKIQSEGKEIAALWYGFITMYDEDGDVIKSQFSWDKEIKDYLDDTAAKIVDESWFIKIECDDCSWDKIYHYFINECGVYLPKDRGIWRYDNMMDEWVEFNKDYEEFKKKWTPVGIRF